MVLDVPRFPRLVSFLVVTCALACAPDDGKDASPDTVNTIDTADTATPVDTSADTDDTATDDGDTSVDTSIDTSIDTSVDTSVDTDTDTGGSDTRDLPAGACRSWEDCSDAEQCVDEETPTCGACRPAVRECEDDDACGGGNVCREYTPDCSCGDGPSSTCVPACVVDTDCDTGEQCDLTTGQCAAWSCMDGYTCPSQHDCTPGVGGTDCLRRACADDTACDGEGWCVNGACFDTVGVCELPRP